MYKRQALTPAAETVKHALLKRWQDTETGRQETLVDWQATHAADGTLMLSARIDGPNPGRALHQFADRQSQFLANRPEPGDRLPVLDVSAEGREACVWRTQGVWVEIWCPDTATTVQDAPGSVPAPASPVPGPSPRGLLGGRLPFARNRRKETAA